MNCDQAFDCLTDSHRRHSAELERHLAGCPRCRQMHDTLEPALDLFDEVVEEPDLSGLVRDPRPMVSTESRQLAEQTAARLVATGGGTIRQRRANWSGFVRYAAIFLFGAGALLGLGVAQDLFQKSDCTFRQRPVIRWGADQSDAVVARCLGCHPGAGGATPPPAGSAGTKGNWTQVGGGAPVRMETFLAVRRQRLTQWEIAVGNRELRAFVCTVLERLPRRASAPAICESPLCNHVLAVARTATRVTDRDSVHVGRPSAHRSHGHIAGTHRDRDGARWS